MTAVPSGIASRMTGVEIATPSRNMPKVRPTLFLVSSAKILAPSALKCSTTTGSFSCPTPPWNCSSALLRSLPVIAAGSKRSFTVEEEIAAALDGVAQGCHGVGNVAPLDGVELGAVDELRAAGEVETELKGPCGVYLAAVDVPADAGAHNEDYKRDSPFLPHGEQYTRGLR